MAPSLVSLPSFRIENKLDKTILTSTGELNVNLPDSFGTAQTALELEQVVGKARVWIARQGLCHFMIDLSINGVPISQAGVLRHLETMMIGCEVWERLEVRLVPVTEPRSERTNRTTYSIQHPDLSSALIPPDTASVAVFRSVLYSIDLLTSQGDEIFKTEATRRSNGKRIRLCTETTATRSTRESDENQEYNSLGSADQNAVDDFLGEMNFILDTNIPSEVARKRRKVDEVTVVTSSSHVKTLLYAWLESVLFGGRICSKSVTFLDKNSAAPLSQLAPGVFNVPYLRNVSAKRRFISTISASLARLGNAESPSLRKKVERLGINTQEHGTSGTEHDLHQICAGIELRIWSILAAEPFGLKKGTRSRLPSR